MDLVRNLVPWFFSCTEPGCGQRFPTAEKLGKHFRLHMIIDQQTVASSNIQVKNEIYQNDRQDESCYVDIIKGVKYGDEDYHDLPGDEASDEDRYVRLHGHQLHDDPVSKILPGIHYKLEPNNRNIYTCSYDEFCTMSFPTLDRLKQHVADFHSQDRPYKCRQPGCGMAFRWIQGLMKHITKHSADGGYVCQRKQCGMVFSKKHELRKHGMTHKEDCTFACPEEGCNDMFRSESWVRRHVDRVHRQPRPFVCNVGDCRQAFTTDRRLRTHKWTHGDGMVYRCPKQSCSRTFLSKEQFDLHEKRHKKMRVYICKHEGCGKGFKTSTSLHQHIPLHSDERKWKCKVANCGKAFKTDSKLRQHLVSHSDYRPFVCPEESCKTAFKFRQALLKHMTIHSQESVVCPYPRCAKVYKTQPLLDHHLRSHQHQRKRRIGMVSEGKVPLVRNDYTLRERKVKVDEEKDLNITDEESCCESQEKDSIYEPSIDSKSECGN